jgi:hypothetical protein
VTTLSLNPNPFSKQVQIRYTIQDAGYRIENSSLKIYDSSGRCVKNLINNQSLKPKAQSLIWFGDDHNGQAVPAGVYFVQLKTNDCSLVKKAVLLK